MKLKKGDNVIIITGKDKGKKGKLTNLNFKRSVAIVEGVNLVKKAMKPDQENPSGGFAELEKGIHFSNIALVSPKTGSATRVRIEVKDGKKTRVATKCGSVLS